MPEPQKELLTVPEFIELYGISRTSVYAEAKAQRLRLTKYGRSTFVAREDANAWKQVLRENSLHGEAQHAA